jgi:hypothetical protein
MWGRLLIGCAIAGGLLIVAGLAAFLFGMYWLTSAGRQYPTAAVASPETQGVVRVGDLASDAGARSLVTAFFRRVQEASQSEKPQLPAWIRNLQAQQAREGVGQWLPREATVSMEPGADGWVRIVMAANMRGFVQPIRLGVTQALKKDKETRITHHGGHEVLSFGGHSSVTFMDGTLVFAYHAGAMTQAIDRLSASAAATPAPDRGLAGTWDVSGWLRQEPTMITLNWLAQVEEEDGPPERSPLPTPPAGLTALRFGLDVQSAEQAQLSAELEFESAEAAVAARQWVADLIAFRIGRLRSWGLTVSSTESAEGARIRYDLALAGLETTFGRMVAEEGRARRERRNPSRSR